MPFQGSNKRFVCVYVSAEISGVELHEGGNSRFSCPSGLGDN